MGKLELLRGITVLHYVSEKKLIISFLEKTLGYLKYCQVEKKLDLFYTLKKWSRSSFNGRKIEGNKF